MSVRLKYVPSRRRRSGGQLSQIDAFCPVLFLSEPASELPDFVKPAAGRAVECEGSMPANSTSRFHFPA